jgi:hypothetical protein
MIWTLFETLYSFIISFPDTVQPVIDGILSRCFAILTRLAEAPGVQNFDYSER